MRLRATRRGAVIAVAAALLSISSILGARSFPISTDQSVLPPGTELYQDGPEQPRELFKSDAIGGRRSYLVDLGDMAFSSPGILGGAARQAGMSCNTCHLNGTTNSKLFVPGLSTRPGNFDTTGHLFNAKADNGMLDPVTIPSLRGARFLAPYGHDGRMASLRDFVHNVVVNEFAGPEPSPEILDALVAYIQDIDFLPNPRLAPGAHLASTASDVERRGEALFAKPFPHDPGLSCAACHTPTGAFVDHQQHNVGSGGLFKTPTLLNADFNAPYFHDGRYDTYDEVVAHFDRVYGLGLSQEDRSDLVAYLTAVGDGERAVEPVSIDAQLLEISHFVGVARHRDPRPQSRSHLPHRRYRRRRAPGVHGGFPRPQGHLGQRRQGGAGEGAGGAQGAGPGAAPGRCRGVLGEIRRGRRGLRGLSRDDRGRDAAAESGGAMVAVQPGGPHRPLRRHAGALPDRDQVAALSRPIPPPAALRSRSCRQSGAPSRAGSARARSSRPPPRRTSARCRRP